jgi:hypothetical protein
VVLHIKNLMLIQSLEVTKLAVEGLKNGEYDPLNAARVMSLSRNIRLHVATEIQSRMTEPILCGMPRRARDANRKRPKKAQLRFVGGTDAAEYALPAR